VAIKHEIDEWAKNGSHRWAVPQGVHRHCSSNPYDFVRTVIPFLGEAPTNGVSAWVPIDLVVGDSHKWSYDSIKEIEREPCRAFFVHPDRAEYGNKNCAEYELIDGLGIVVSQEGKNRVRFLAAMGERLIPAYVSRRDYPAAERIHTYDVDVGDRTETWAVLDNRQLRRLPAPGLVQPLLRAYGVRHSNKWPREFPQPMDVLSYIRKDIERTTYRRPDKPWDMDEIRRQQNVELEGLHPLPVMVTDIATVGINVKAMGYFAAALAAGALLIRFVPALQREGMADYIFGVNCCMAVFFFGRVFKARPIDLFDWPQHRYRLLAKWKKTEVESTPRTNK
jgi:hypothetical protein